MDQAWLLVVVDVDTGGARLVDEQPNVRLEDVSGTAEDGQRAKPGQVGGEWTDARVAEGQGAAPVPDEHAGPLPPQPRIAGLNDIDLGVGERQVKSGRDEHGAGDSVLAVAQQNRGRQGDLASGGIPARQVLPYRAVLVRTRSATAGTTWSAVPNGTRG